VKFGIQSFEFRVSSLEFQSPKGESFEPRFPGFEFAMPTNVSISHRVLRSLAPLDRRGVCPHVFRVRHTGIVAQSKRDGQAE
jgi:hypothetical protein